MSYKIALTSLGCSKNLVDSEVMLGILNNLDFKITDNLSEAHVIIVNTCGFILPAKEESIETILSMIPYKHSGTCQVLIVTGCLIQKYGEELKEEIPEIDGFLGTADFDKIGQLVCEKLGIPVPENDQISGKKRMLTTPAHSAYVKIAEGCDNKCTYCLIPQLRGPFVSRPKDDIINEVREMAASGVKEINLIAQDSTFYGMDLTGRKMLPELLNDLAAEDISWIRVLYCYPWGITQELLDVMAKHHNICKYLDLPIQHADSEILRKMGRKENREYLTDLVANIRKTIPDIALRTTCMVGFPGETDEQFNHLMEFVEEMRFDWLGVFTYSQEDDTPAAAMRNQVPENVKDDRYHQLMSLQSKISLENNRKWIGKTISVLIEGKSEERPECFLGRSQYQAPEIDGVVFIKAPALEIGNFVQVRISDADIYDLIGEI